jgi:hypothetical protein
LNGAAGRRISGRSTCRAECGRFRTCCGNVRAALGIKTNAIDDLKNTKYVVEAMKLDAVSVNVYGATAVSFTSQEEKSRYDGTDTSGHYHFTDVWVKTQGRWQAVASHGTRYDQSGAAEIVQ